MKGLPEPTTVHHALQVRHAVHEAADPHLDQSGTHFRRHLCCSVHATPSEREPTRAGTITPTSQGGISAANTRGMGLAQALLHHLFCELKLAERMKEEIALAVMDLISALTAHMDEHALELQDTDACQSQGVKSAEDLQAGDVLSLLPNRLSVGSVSR
ncbi:hypothetical protein CYMTET_52286 [Cymbomonas tetramitiformis]|uniref:Uncharacterized protein n=1 Tax=Cymbomonas tetramitiformis TaxID=36881 RepID=A0AAE0EQY5_9CHLO|nr:hypothetical protein CYMTET_52286 [Cymbomonas tetramitiformis]